MNTVLSNLLASASIGDAHTKVNPLNRLCNEVIVHDFNVHVLVAAILVQEYFPNF